MNHALFVPSFGAFADLAVQVEAADWDGLNIWDHILIEDGTPICDFWVAMAAAATVTERIRLGPMVTPTPRRHPWKLAREIVSLDRLSKGRVDFGVGIGYPPEVEYGTIGHETDSRVLADRLGEGLAVITGMWTGEPFAYYGTHYQVEERTFRPKPYQNPEFQSGWLPPGPTHGPFGGLRNGMAYSR